MSETMTTEQAASKLTNIMNDDHYAWSPAAQAFANHLGGNINGTEGTD